jgi:DNA adenine methylase
VLGVLAPARAQASDSFAPLIGIWQALRDGPDELVDWYRARWQAAEAGDRAAVYDELRARFNAHRTPADLIYLSRASYGGVIRFRRRDGHMSTPLGQHRPIHPDKFAAKVAAWTARVQGTRFGVRDYAASFARARAGDVVYCDPPYSHSQSILYGAQGFDLDDLYARIERAKRRGVFVALSLDGAKKSGGVICDHRWPPGLFEREVPVNLGASMLKRFQMEGQRLDGERVVDRLLLTHRVRG